MAEQSPLERSIGDQIAQLQARYYGAGPARVFTQATDRVVIVVLEETFSVAERTLIARNESEGIQDIRRRLADKSGDGPGRRPARAGRLPGDHRSGDRGDLLG
jgi:uncharacterized protein YbcI